MFLPLWFSDDGYIRPVTFWVVGDFDKPSGRQLLYDAIRHMVQHLSKPSLSLFYYIFDQFCTVKKSGHFLIYYYKATAQSLLVIEYINLCLTYICLNIDDGKTFFLIYLNHNSRPYYLPDCGIQIRIVK